MVLNVLTAQRSIVSLLLMMLCHSLYLPGQQKTVELVGSSLKYGLPGIALGSALIHSSEDKPVLYFASSFASTALLTYGLKYTISKDRPDSSGTDAFPSGHAAMAFQGAVYLYKRYGYKAGLPALALAGFVGWSRVYAQKHDWYDVGAGAVIGAASSLVFTRRWKKTSGEVGLQALPNKGVGIHISMQF
jgi:membrane-associated phospholipid phosphatase